MDRLVYEVNSRRETSNELFVFSTMFNSPSASTYCWWCGRHLIRSSVFHAVLKILRILCKLVFPEPLCVRPCTTMRIAIFCISLCVLSDTFTTLRLLHSGGSSTSILGGQWGPGVSEGSRSPEKFCQSYAQIYSCGHKTNI